MTRRTSRERAREALWEALQAGDISGYHEGKSRWVVQVRATRAKSAVNSQATGGLSLTSKEVFAFTEGRWAANRIHPVTRSGH